MTTLVRREYNFISDISGFKFKSHRMRIMIGELGTLVVDQGEWNPQHPQLYLKPRADRQNVPNARVPPPDYFPPPVNPLDV